MEPEIYSEDFEDTLAEAKENENIFKITPSFLRVIICSLILGMFALTKHFNYDNYKKFGNFYNQCFKRETVNVVEIREKLVNKTDIIHEFIKNRIDNL